jgi:hypothetical protein
VWSHGVPPRVERASRAAHRGPTCTERTPEARGADAQSAWSGRPGRAERAPGWSERTTEVVGADHRGGWSASPGWLERITGRRGADHRVRAPRSTYAWSGSRGTRTALPECSHRTCGVLGAHIPGARSGQPACVEPTPHSLTHGRTRRRRPLPPATRTARPRRRSGTRAGETDAAAGSPRWDVRTDRARERHPQRAGSLMFPRRGAPDGKLAPTPRRRPIFPSHATSRIAPRRSLLAPRSPPSQSSQSPRRRASASTKK